MAPSSSLTPKTQHKALLPASTMYNSRITARPSLRALVTPAAQQRSIPNIVFAASLTHKGLHALLQRFDILLRTNVVSVASSRDGLPLYRLRDILDRRLIIESAGGERQATYIDVCCLLAVYPGAFVLDVSDRSGVLVGPTTTTPEPERVFAVRDALARHMLLSSVGWQWSQDTVDAKLRATEGGRVESASLARAGAKVARSFSTSVEEQSELRTLIAKNVGVLDAPLNNPSRAAKIAVEGLQRWPLRPAGFLTTVTATTPAPNPVPIDHLGFTQEADQPTVHRMNMLMNAGTSTPPTLMPARISVTPPLPSSSFSSRSASPVEPQLPGVQNRLSEVAEMMFCRSGKTHLATLMRPPPPVRPPPHLCAVNALRSVLMKAKDRAAENPNNRNYITFSFVPIVVLHQCELRRALQDSGIGFAGVNSVMKEIEAIRKENESTDSFTTFQNCVLCGAPGCARCTAPVIEQLLEDSGERLRAVLESNSL